jgi:DNA replication and repair protein RecF
VYLQSLELTDFRSYRSARFEPAPVGLTVVTGLNGAGKTNLIEATAYLAITRSVRGAASAAMVRAGAESAVLRSRVGSDPGSPRLVGIDAELRAEGRDRLQVNAQALRRSRDLLAVFQVTVFSPEDLALVKGGPAGRRDYLDGLTVAVSPLRRDLVGELERILRQRNALLRSAPAAGWRPGRPLPEDVGRTLDVWDARLSEVGESLAEARGQLVAALGPHVARAYRELATGSAPPERLEAGVGYSPSWRGPLERALAEARGEDLRRGVTTVGPQRDDLGLEVGGWPARSHASQGEQRTLALALRLAGHRLLRDAHGTSPVLLLDDVFSELDPARARSLVANLPSLAEAQAVLTTAGALPAGVGADSVAARYRVADGQLTRE